MTFIILDTIVRMIIIGYVSYIILKQGDNMEVIKQNIKFSNLPKEQKKVEVDIVAYDLKFTFAKVCKF